MPKRKKLLLAMLLVIVVAGIGIASMFVWSPARAEQAGIVEQGPITWDVIASGGTTMSSGSFIMLSTTGQPIAGPSSGPNHTLLSGYWQAFVDKVLLPIFYG